MNITLAMGIVKFCGSMFIFLKPFLIKDSVPFVEASLHIWLKIIGHHSHYILIRTESTRKYLVA